MRRFHQLTAVALAGVAVAGIAGCGSSSSSTSGGSSGEAAKAPSQIVADAQAALRSASGFVVSGSIVQQGQATQLKIVNGGSGGLELTISRAGSGTAQIITTSSAAYIRADAQFWTANSGTTAAHVLAGRWIKEPASSTGSVTSAFGRFSPSTLSRCLGEDLGTLSKGGTTTVNGQKAVIIHDAGNVPGSTPGALVVADSGTAYPLEVTSTGATRAGGKVDVCNDGKGGDQTGSLTLSDFTDPPKVAAPADAITPQAAAKLNAGT